MKKLRKGVVEGILKQLDTILFSKNAFDVSYNDKSGEILKIVFRENPDFKFVVTQPGKRATWKTSECPGDVFTETEEYSIPDFPRCQQRIIPWTNKILEEYTL